MQLLLLPLGRKKKKYFNELLKRYCYYITFDASLFITFTSNHLYNHLRHDLRYDCLHRINKFFSNNSNDPLICRYFYTYIKKSF